MMIPEQISSQVHDETWAGITYHIRGELVPELQVDVSGASVFFEHHTLLWKETDVKIEIRKMKGAASARSPVASSSSPRRSGPEGLRSRATRPVS